MIKINSSTKTKIRKGYNSTKSFYKFHFFGIKLFSKTDVDSYPEGFSESIVGFKNKKT